MSTFNINCFGQCLKSQEDESGIAQKFKAKKGRKCLTLVRKGKECNPVHNFQTNQSTALQKTRIQQRQIKRFVTGNLTPRGNIPIQRERECNNSHIIYGRYSNNGNETNRYMVPPVPYTNRERRLSQISYVQHNFQPTSIEIRSNSLQAKQNSQTQSNQSTLDIIKLMPPDQNGFSIIRQEQNESPKRSSLFQGAQSIIQKLAFSSKKPEGLHIELYAIETAQKGNPSEIRNFYDNARLCETQHAINNTHSSIKTQHEEHEFLSGQLSIDAIPMSPKSKNIEKYKSLKIGKLLGVGKWAHVYLCQQVKTNFLYTIKQIFKQSLQYPVTIERIHANINCLMNINHPKIISICSNFQNADKICLIAEYCMRSIYEELKVKGQLCLKEIKNYLSDLIEGLVFLHENDIIHGNVNIFGVFINFSECKIKLNITDIVEEDTKDLDFKSDIASLAIVVHEMAYGINLESFKQDTVYEREKLYKQPESKQAIINSINSHLQQQQKSEDCSLLNSFISMLLNWSPQSRLTSSICLNHPFFNQEIPL